MLLLRILSEGDGPRGMPGRKDIVEVVGERLPAVMSVGSREASSTFGIRRG